LTEKTGRLSQDIPGRPGRGTLVFPAGGTFHISALFTDRCLYEMSKPFWGGCLLIETASFRDEPRLLSECPACRKPLKFNPFLVDNKEVYP
jgi:hypothetical protein